MTSPDQDFPVDANRVIQSLARRLSEEILQTAKLETIIGQLVAEKVEAEQRAGAGDPPTPT